MNKAGYKYYLVTREWQYYGNTVSGESENQYDSISRGDIKIIHILSVLINVLNVLTPIRYYDYTNVCM